MKNLIFIFILTMMAYNNLSANETVDNDTCIGVVNITNFHISGIPLYEKPESAPFDTLNFKFRLENGEIIEIDPKVEEFAVSVSAQLIVNLKSEEIFKPYHFYVGEKKQWEHYRGPKFMVYKLSLRLIGDYGDWLCVVINEEVNRTAFIRRDEIGMRFISWEKLIKDWGGIIFSSSDIYDSKNGKRVKLKKIEKEEARHIGYLPPLNKGYMVGQIISIEGDWLSVRHKETDYWIKWKDKNGLLVRKFNSPRIIF